jgi:hypothetical protein
MQDRHIGDVRVTRIEEQMGPGFPAKDFFPEFDADIFAAEGHWLAPSYYQPESGRLMTSIHSWLLRTGKHTILVDACMSTMSAGTRGWRTASGCRPSPTRST